MCRERPPWWVAGTRTCSAAVHHTYGSVPITRPLARTPSLLMRILPIHVAYISSSPVACVEQRSTFIEVTSPGSHHVHHKPLSEQTGFLISLGFRDLNGETSDRSPRGRLPYTPALVARKVTMMRGVHNAVAHLFFLYMYTVSDTRVCV